MLLAHSRMVRGHRRSVLGRPSFLRAWRRVLRGRGSSLRSASSSRRGTSRVLGGPRTFVPCTVTTLREPRRLVDGSLGLLRRHRTLLRVRGSFVRGPAITLRRRRKDASCTGSIQTCNVTILARPSGVAGRAASLSRGARAALMCQDFNVLWRFTVGPSEGDLPPGDAPSALCLSHPVSHLKRVFVLGRRANKCERGLHDGLRRSHLLFTSSTRRVAAGSSYMKTMLTSRTRTRSP
jgi:hypothetical protein